MVKKKKFLTSHGSQEEQEWRKYRLNCSILIGNVGKLEYTAVHDVSFSGGERGWRLIMCVEHSKRGGWGLDRYGAFAYSIHRRLAMEYTSPMGWLPSGSILHSESMWSLRNMKALSHPSIILLFNYVRKWNWYHVQSHSNNMLGYRRLPLAAFSGRPAAWCDVTLLLLPNTRTVLQFSFRAAETLVFTDCDYC